MSVASSDYGREYQAKSLLTAYREGQPWTDNETALLYSPELTLLEMAQKIGRSYWSVHVKRHRLGLQESKLPGDRAGSRQLDSPFDIQPTETICTECFLVQAKNGVCGCLS